MANLESKEFVQEVRDKLYPGEAALNDRVKAFQITKHVAWYLKDLGYGLVKAKPGSENNAEGFTNDVIAKSNGFHIDVLEDGEGEAKATWDPHEDPDEMKAIKPRWVMPLQVPDIFAEPDEPKPEPESNGDNGESEQLEPQLLELLVQIIANQRENTMAIQELASTVASTNSNLQKVASDLQKQIEKGIPIRFGR